LPEEVELPPLQLKIVCIVALTSITALTSEGSAAGRARHAAEIAKQPSHQTQMTHGNTLHLAKHQAQAVHGKEQHARGDEQYAAGAKHRLAREPGRRTAQNGRPSRDAVEAVGGIKSHVAHDKHDDGTASPGTFSGFASYYGDDQNLASGGTFKPSRLTCAHRSLPFGTHLRVADPESGRSVVVTVNDRGPFVHGRILDLSFVAARALGMIGRGVMRVEASVL
jgi:rare lipoprotein A